jgi:hypothetical protein
MFKIINIYLSIKNVYGVLGIAFISFNLFVSDFVSFSGLVLYLIFIN